MGCTPPVYVVAYQFHPQDQREGQERDQRHLVSCKSYYFKVAVWSALKPPQPAVLQEIVGRHEPDQEEVSHREARLRSRRHQRVMRALRHAVQAICWKDGLAC